MSPAETTEFFKSFTKLNTRIQKFRDSLLPPNAVAACPTAVRPRLIFAHSVAHAATIQLNHSFVLVNPQCRELCLSACRSIVWIIRTVSFRSLPHINPVIGSIWSTTAHVLVEESTRLRAVPQTAAVIADLTSAYNEIVASVALFSKKCPFMGAFGGIAFLDPV
jgi:hypothetical protein